MIRTFCTRPARMAVWSRYDRRTSLSQDISPWPLPAWRTEINGRKYRAPWTPMLAMSPIEKNTLFLGTQFVMKTTDEGLHWEKISPDLTGAAANLPADKSNLPITVQNAKERGFGVVYSIAPSPKKADVIWAGSDTGLIHLTQDGGKTWDDVTPKGLGEWSKIAMIEASHFDPAVAYAAVDRHRLDDQAPYLYRTRDYGKTWQSIATGIGATSFVNAIREDTHQHGTAVRGYGARGLCIVRRWRSLAAAAVELAGSVGAGPDRARGRSGNCDAWAGVLDPGQHHSATPDQGAGTGDEGKTVSTGNGDTYRQRRVPGKPVPAGRTDGEESAQWRSRSITTLPAKAAAVKLELFDAKGALVRRYVSSEKKAKAHQPLPIAPEWFPPPVSVETSAGMHRFVWDLRWNSSGTGEEFEDEEYGAPQGPRVTPGQYQVRLTVNGTAVTESLQVQMDPRSKATGVELEQQLSLGLQIFAAVRSSRQALAELNAVKANLGKLKGESRGEAELLGSHWETGRGDRGR